MAATAQLESVVTGDSTPAVAPYRISNKGTKDAATVKFHALHDGHLVPCDQMVPADDLIPEKPQPMIAYRLQMGGSSPYTGTNVGKKGKLCSPGGVCSPSKTAGHWSQNAGGPLKVGQFKVSAAGQKLTTNTPQTQTEVITYAETGAPGDGDQTVTLWVNIRYQGWHAAT